MPSLRSSEDRGLVVHSATAVKTAPRSSVLVGDSLLNRNLNFIDTIDALVYRTREGGSQGATTLFLEDLRISTNARLFEDVRASSTRVSAEVRHAVLDQGQILAQPRVCCKRLEYLRLSAHHRQLWQPSRYVVCRISRSALPGKDTLGLFYWLWSAAVYFDFNQTFVFAHGEGYIFTT